MSAAGGGGGVGGGGGGGGFSSLFIPMLLSRAAAAAAAAAEASPAFIRPPRPLILAAPAPVPSIFPAENLLKLRGDQTTRG